MPRGELSLIADAVLDWAVQRDWKGSDPYDGLNSRLLAPLLQKSRFFRLAVIQAVKNCPINLRPILLVPSGRNPKGLALFLSGTGFRQSAAPSEKNRALITRLEQLILSLASKPDGTPAFSADRSERTDITEEEVGNAGVFAWGYNFPWQSRAFLQPAWFPTVVCSSFVLDAFKDSGSRFYPIVAKTLARFVLDSLNIHRDSSGICFSYSPGDHTRVFNASLFAARILARAADFVEETKETEKYRSLAEEACGYVRNRQRKDGSWVYGEADHWQWVDNLHTGFVLETLHEISAVLKTAAFRGSIQAGLEYYRNNLFTEDGTAKYFNDRTYPIDPHSFAQGAITLAKLGHQEQAEAVLNRAVLELWNKGKRGFVVRKSRYISDSQIHMRWNQGWIFKALCFVLMNGGRFHEDLV